MILSGAATASSSKELQYGTLTQLGECFPYKEEVRSSSLLSSIRVYTSARHQQSKDNRFSLIGRMLLSKEEVEVRVLEAN